MKNAVISAVVGLAALGTANAAIVDQGATTVGGGGGIELVSGGNAILQANGLYSSQTTTPASDWVWTDNGDQTTTWTFTFDLTGFDKSTAVLSGLWGVDNTGTIDLNGTQIANLPVVTTANFTSLISYSTSDSSLFNMGMNVLTFVLSDAGGPEAFRATATVEADTSAIPVPAALPLFLAGLAVVARKRRK
ncbi:hypothetical protein HK107_12835 [Parvularcula sp. ZS-1/3]|uniref:VPLPA-CTERM sorting domain-containing protein n=1 Tax=Parvularcula mediterranea TaxID=2732508 RepID=A0A7Y3W5X5_9PROT|nr:MYXO-CTERM sorting domain-containing protein [Parvularcula mediterranea]NNU17210.1 hypothetical protein [Parvularcula mediterranea]